MGRIWNHPHLGTVEFDNECDNWVGACRLPAFEVFKWGNKSTTRAEKHELTFDDTEGREPSTGAVQVALAVLANQARLPSLITSALWEEFNGRGPKCEMEMWWNGDMDEVARVFGYDDRHCPTGPDDLLPVMRFSGLTIHESVSKYKKSIAELRFAAVFEEEHGIGILTDGSRILGTGYAYDAELYESI